MKKNIPKGYRMLRVGELYPETFYYMYLPIFKGLDSNKLSNYNKESTTEPFRFQKSFKNNFLVIVKK